MFRKIVSNLAFSPALVGQLGFYAKRLKKEEATRRIGLVFTVLALVVQSFAVFSPPESANAANPSDFVSGGVSSMSEFGRYYDQNANNIKDIFTSLGITRSEIQAAKKGTINSKEVFSWGMTSRFSAAQGERTYSYQKSGGKTGTVYYRPLKLWDTKPYTIKNGSTYDAWIGHSAKFGWFAIMKNCGNLITKRTPPPAPKPAAACKELSVQRISRTRYQLDARATVANGATIKSYTFAVAGGGKTTKKTVTTNSTSASYTYDQETPGDYTATLSVVTSEGTKSSAACATKFTVAKPQMCAYNQSLPVNSPDCQPCPGDSLIWIKDEKCEAKVVQTKKASNISQGNLDATTVTAKASNKIAYTVTVENKGLNITKAEMKEELDDVLEYATLADNGGATFDKETKSLTWPAVTLKPGEKQSRVFVVQLASTIPAVAQGKSDRTSYDCRMTNTFGNAVDISVNCPAPKQVEQIVEELPHTGATENMLFGGGVLAVVAYFYARSRQVKKEVRLIRRDLNAGTI